MLENKFYEVTKGNDSDVNSEEFMKHKHGEQWCWIDADTTNILVSCVPSMIKWVIGMNYYGEMINHMEKSNTKAACSLCGEIEDWDHMFLCEQNKNEKQEWVKGLEKN